MTLTAQAHSAHLRPYLDARQELNCKVSGLVMMPDGSQVSELLAGIFKNGLFRCRKNVEQQEEQPNQSVDLVARAA